VATVLKNVLRFTGLAVGVPESQAHGLQIGYATAAPRALTPQQVFVPVGPFNVSVDDTNVTVTRRNNSPSDAVDVYVEWTHSIDQTWPPSGVPAGVPFVVQGGSLTAAFDPARTIVVAQTGGDAQTIEAGLTQAGALVPAPDATNPAMVWVFPGVYVEDPLTVPTGVTLWGHGAAATLVTANVATQPLLTVGAGAEIRDLRVQGASGVGGIGLLDQAAGRAIVRGLCILDCTTGIRATGANVILFVHSCCLRRPPLLVGHRSHG
jgi:hypothetical protein